MGGDALITIGLTGKYCSGKSYIASLFAQRNMAVIDVDHLGHTTLETVKEQVVTIFGKQILSATGVVDRKQLGAVVFADPAKLAILESLMHPVMVETCKGLLEEYKEQGKEAVLINAALLHRMQLDTLCDFACFVYAPSLIRYLRAVRRDKASCRSFRRIAKAQKDISPECLIGPSAVYILENWKGEGYIHRQIDQFCGTMGI